MPETISSARQPMSLDQMQIPVSMDDFVNPELLLHAQEIVNEHNEGLMVEFQAELAEAKSPDDIEAWKPKPSPQEASGNHGERLAKLRARYQEGLIG